MVIDGSKIGDSIKKELTEKIKFLTKKPKLVIFLIGNNHISEKYVEIKKKFGFDIGAKVSVVKYDDISEKDLVKKIKEANKDKNITGIIVQLPLPVGLDTEKILDSINSKKDIDCLSSQECKMTPPLVAVLQKIFEETKFNYKDKNILIVGFGRLVGKPITKFFHQKNLLPVVIDENNKGDLKKEAKKADLIISGVGVPSLITGEMVKERVFLVDAGVNYKGGKIFGDIDKSAYKKASFYTSVPGGVGPITVAMLFRNLVVRVDNL